MLFKLSLFCILISSLWANPHFEGIKTLYVEEVEGKVSISCRWGHQNNGGSGWANWDCKGANIRPKDHAFFQLNDSNSSNGKYFKMTFTKPSGEVKNLKGLFDKKRGQSKRALYFSVGEDGLLEEGTNIVTYALYDKKDEELQSGTFSINVVHSAKKVCADGKMFSTSRRSCRDQALTCRRYFSYYENSCR
jgi:hypothetical protein